MSVGGRTFSSAGVSTVEYIPGAYSRVDAVNGGAGFVAFGNCVIMGQGYGPQPDVLMQYTTLSQAMNAIYGGPILDAVRFAFNPGNGVVPQQVFVMVVNSSLQSTAYAVNSTPANIIEFTSQQYGLHTTQITKQLQAGTTTGVKLTLTFKTTTEVYDNIDQALMTVQCTGASVTAATLTIVNNNTTNTFDTTVTGGTTASLSISLGNFDTIGDLVAYINNQPGYTATVGAGYYNTPVTQLDQVSTIDILTSAQTLYGIEWAIINTVNSNSGLVTAQDVSGTAGIQPPVYDTSPVYLAGGSNGTYQATDWTTALTALEAENVQYVATPDSTLSVITAISAHCTLMSSTNERHERQFFAGGSWGDTTSTALTNANSINNYLGSYVFNGGYQYDINGNLAQYGASYGACMLAAMKSAVSTNVPLTRKTLSWISLEQKLNESTLVSLIQGSVLPVSYNVNGVPTVVRQLTTYQADNLMYNELSMVTEMNFVQADLRNYLDSLFVGNPTIKTMLGAIKGAVQTRLNSYVTLGIFTQDSAGNTWWNLSVQISGDTATIDFDANLTAPMNFLFITAHLHVAT